MSNEDQQYMGSCKSEIFIFSESEKFIFLVQISVTVREILNRKMSYYI